MFIHPFIPFAMNPKTILISFFFLGLSLSAVSTYAQQEVNIQYRARKARLINVNGQNLVGILVNFIADAPDGERSGRGIMLIDRGWINDSCLDEAWSPRINDPAFYQSVSGTGTLSIFNDTMMIQGPLNPEVISSTGNSSRRSSRQRGLLRLDNLGAMEFPNGFVVPFRYAIRE